jgi:hypothetical protein
MKGRQARCLPPKVQIDTPYTYSQEEAVEAFPPSRFNVAQMIVRRTAQLH